ncbi:hypothetical protein ACA910_007283 [Epithemia clementina (nom. ined.)]
MPQNPGTSGRVPKSHCPGLPPPPPPIQIYLNGVYASMNAWRPDRDEEGWRLNIDKIDAESEHNEAPARVRMVPRMKTDVTALESLTTAANPPECLIRPSKWGSVARYLFVDASGAGFGMSGWSHGEMEIEVDFGSWGDPVSMTTSSNYRELGNIVMKIEQMDRNHRLNELVEIFVFTDNYHAESAFCRGTAKSSEVLALMTRLHVILMKGYAFIHMIWVSGKRMVDQGTDGISQADFTNGVMRGMSMLHFVPIHQTAVARQPRVIQEFIRSITGQAHMVHLNPTNGFTTAQAQDGLFLWTPPPCLSNIAVHLLTEAVHKRPWNTHLILIPSLMAGHWQKTLYKASDFLAVLPFGPELWPKETEYEPLSLAFVFPLLNRKPWRVKFSDVCKQCNNSVRTLHRTDVAQARNYLFKFWIQARALEPLPSDLSQLLLQGASGEESFSHWTKTSSKGRNT